MSISLPKRLLKNPCKYTPIYILEDALRNACESISKGMFIESLGGVLGRAVRGYLGWCLGGALGGLLRELFRGMFKGKFRG